MKVKGKRIIKKKNVILVFLFLAKKIDKVKNRNMLIINVIDSEKKLEKNIIKRLIIKTKLYLYFPSKYKNIDVSKRGLMFIAKCDSSRKIEDICVK
tara:strand:+ start:41 stop:328 length:288 start_codon:yes stop_codon:yes gene_type:complete